MVHPSWSSVFTIIWCWGRSWSYVDDEYKDLGVVLHGWWSVLNNTVRQVHRFVSLYRLQPLIKQTTRMVYIKYILYIPPNRKLHFERHISWYFFVCSMSAGEIWWFVCWYWRNCLCHHLCPWCLRIWYKTCNFILH